MQQRSLGNSGITVSPIGLGLAALGRPGYINLGHESDLEANYDVEAMQARAHRVLDAAWEAGVRYFDAARSYGRAENFLSSWLNERGYTDLTVSSKWGYTYTADWQVQAQAHEIKDHSLALLDKQITQSLELLDEHLHVYQIHSATMDTGVLDNQAVLERLAELKASSGLRIGLSVSGENQAEVIRKAVATKVNHSETCLFDTCQATWNILEPSASSALAEAHSAGLGIIIKEGLANGRLTSRNSSTAFQDNRAILDGFAKQLGCSIDALALSAILAQPWVDTVLSGAASVEHLVSNASAVSLQMTEEVLNELAAIAETPEQYWATRTALSWN